MANANFFTSTGVAGLTDYLLAVSRSTGDAAQDARVIQPSALFLLLLRAFPTSLTANERTAIRNALSVSSGLTQQQVETLIEASGDEIVTALGALSGSARLSYTKLKDAPTIPAGVSLVSRTDAEGGTATAAHSWSAQRVAQAIAALGVSVTVSSTAPTSPRAGDVWQRTGSTSPGLYIRLANSWSTVSTPLDGVGVVALLAGLSGTERLGYGSLKDTPTIPTVPAVLTSAEATTASSTRDGLISGRRLSQAVGAFGVAVTVSSTAPTSPKAGDVWHRTGSTDPGLYIRNAANDGWVTVATGSTLDGPDIVTLLAALSGAARLGYGSLKDTPTIPAALTEMPENEAEAGTASTLRAATARRFKAAVDALGIRFRTGDDLPADGDSVDGRDLFAKTGTSDPGLYWRSSGSWTIVLSPGSGGGTGGLNQAQVDARISHYGSAFTADEKTKLGRIEDRATADQTGAQIALLLNALADAARVSYDSLKDTPEIGSTSDAEAGTDTTGKLYSAHAIKSSSKDRIRSGSTAPSNSLGVEGDVYFRVLSGNITEIYGKGSNNRWSKLADVPAGGGSSFSFTHGSAAPTGGSDGDWYVRTGSTLAGLYNRASGTWTRVLAPGAGGSGTTWTVGDAEPTGGSAGDFHYRTGASDPGIYYNDAGTWGRIFDPDEDSFHFGPQRNEDGDILNRWVKGGTSNPQGFDQTIKPVGGATDGTTTWLVDGANRRVVAMGYSGNNRNLRTSAREIERSVIATAFGGTADDIDLSDCFIYDDSKLYLVDKNSKWARAFDISGDANPTHITPSEDIDFSAHSDDDIDGAVSDGTHVWFLSSVGQIGYAYALATRTYAAAMNLSNAELRAASTDIAPVGGFFHDRILYVISASLNNTGERVYAFDSGHAHLTTFDLTTTILRDRTRSTQPGAGNATAIKPGGGYIYDGIAHIVDSGPEPSQGFTERSYQAVWGFALAHDDVHHLWSEIYRKLGAHGVQKNASIPITLDYGYNTVTIGSEEVTADERTAGTETRLRFFSPADVKSMIDTHGGATDVSDKLERDDLVAGDNITLTPGAGRAVTIASTASGGGGSARALMPEAVAERGLDTTPYAISGQRLDEAIQARAPGTYIAAAERWPERDANWVGGHSSHPIVTGAISYGSNIWLTGANDTLTSFVASSGARDSSRDFSAAQLRGAGSDIDPSGGWGYNGILYVLSQSEDKVYAFRASNKAHERDKDWETAEVVNTDVGSAISLTSGFSNGDLTWLVDAVSRQCFAWAADKVDRNATRTRMAAHDITVQMLDAIAQAFSPRATFTSPDGRYVWIINSATNIAHCIQLANLRRAEERDIPANIITAGRSPVLMRGGCSVGNYGYAVQQVSTNNLRGANVNAFKLPAAQADHYPVVSEAEARAGTETNPRIYSPERVSQQIEKPVADAITIASDLQLVWDGRHGNPAAATIYGPKVFDVDTEAPAESYADNTAYSAGDEVEHNGRVYRAKRSISNTNTTPPPDTHENDDWAFASGYWPGAASVVLGDNQRNSNFSFEFDPPAGRGALAESLSFSIGFKFAQTFENGFWIGMAMNDLGVTESNNLQDRGFQFYVNLKSLASRGVFIEPKTPPSGSSNGNVERVNSGVWRYFNGATDRSGRTDKRFLVLPVWATGNGVTGSSPLRTLTLVHHFGQLAVFADGILYGTMLLGQSIYPFRRHTTGANDYVLGVGTNYRVSTLMGGSGTQKFLLHGVSVGKPRLAEQANPKLEPLDLRRLSIPSAAGTYDIRYVLGTAGGAGKLDFTDPPQELSHGSGLPTGGKDGDYKFRTGLNNPGIYSRAGGNWSRFWNFPQNPRSSVENTAPTLDSDTGGAVGDVRYVFAGDGEAANGVYVKRAAGVGWKKIA